MTPPQSELSGNTRQLPQEKPPQLILVKDDCTVEEAIVLMRQCLKTHPNEPIRITPNARGFRRVSREAIQ